ncbi:MAG: hypothetical protein WBF17_05610 [Phycisphaerae bacterium]
MRIAGVMLPLMLVGSAGPARVELKDDPPPVAAPKSGDISGTIQPAGKVARIEAVSRSTLKTYAPESFEKTTGRFRFAGLPGDADYDVRVVTTEGRTIEGIDLAWIEARMVRLAARRRKDLHLPPERKHAFSMDDVNELMKWVEDWKDFMELKRVLYVQGHGQRATMLVELMRTREFHASAGAVVWRMELWYMKNEFGGWDRLANAERVLHRRRITPGEWRKIDLQYFPGLSAHIDADGKSEPLHYKLPEKGDLSRGRLANTDPNAKTMPHVRGLDVKPEKPVRGFQFGD